MTSNHDTWLLSGPNGPHDDRDYDDVFCCCPHCGAEECECPQDETPEEAQQRVSQQVLDTLRQRGNPVSKLDTDTFMRLCHDIVGTIREATGESYCPYAPAIADAMEQKFFAPW